MLGLIWLPVLSHYRPREIRVTDSMVAAGRHEPAETVLDELRDFDLLAFADAPPAQEIAIAEGILEGRLEVPGLPAAAIGLPFAPDDLDHLPANLQLWFAGYVAPAVLLSAYAETQRDEFFAMARDMIVAWDRYEQGAPLPKGLLWNDHAIAARVRVLGEFWRLYRGRADFRPEVGRAVLEQAARYRELLADPGRFTFATNHGLMQNLALLHLELAFPTLPDGADYGHLALERLGQQMSFLVGTDGVFRENSFGYQAFDLGLLAMTFRCMTLLGVSVPATWDVQYERGLAFLTTLRRPDGTLPAGGDTDGEEQASAIRVTDIDTLGRSSPLRPWEPGSPDGAMHAYLGAGYWTLWDGLDSEVDPAGPSQTVVTFTRPPTQSHKHADEPSVLLWSKGVSWLTSVGYWPYDDASRADAESWLGANAPHLANEPANSPRTARLLWAGSTAGLAAVDVERRGPGDFVARRQVVRIQPDLWVIVDRVEATSAAMNESVWTMAPELSVRREETGSYALEAPGGITGRLTIVGSSGTAVGGLRGSRAPFAGWQVVKSVPRPAPALRVEQPAGKAWLVLVLSTADPNSPQAYAGAAPRVVWGDTPETWTVTLPLASGQLSISRADRRLAVKQARGTSTATSTLELVPAVDPGPERSAVLAAFDQAAAEYPVFQDRMARRSLVSVLVVLMANAQEVFFLGVRRWRPRLHRPLRLLSLVGWAAIALLLQVSLLRSWEILQVG